MNQVTIQNKSFSIQENSLSKSEKSLTGEKEQFVQNLKTWATYDKQLKLLNEKTKELRTQKTELGAKITEFMNEKNIQDKPIELSDGQIRFVERKEYSPLTFSYIGECLEKILADKSQVECVLHYLRENRSVTSVTELKRTYKSQSSLV